MSIVRNKIIKTNGFKRFDELEERETIYFGCVNICDHPNNYDEFVKYYLSKVYVFDIQKGNESDVCMSFRVSCGGDKLTVHKHLNRFAMSGSSDCLIWMTSYPEENDFGEILDLMSWD